jgi:hypothetical protein
MMAKRGPTPSLIGSTHGSVSFDEVGRRSTCRRCGAGMPKGSKCVRVTNPRSMGAGKPYCTTCFAQVLDQTQKKLDELRGKLSHG